MAEIENINKIIEKVSPYYASRKKAKDAGGYAGPVASEEHKLVYDSSSETLEPLYFWIVDLMNSLFKNKVEKIVDNFASTPGSGHFSEIGGKATRMQEEAQKILGTINVIIKSNIKRELNLQGSGKYNNSNRL